MVRDQARRAVRMRSARDANMCRRQADGLLSLVKRGQHERAVELLLTELWSPEQLDSQPDADGTVLFWAALRGYTLVVELVLTMGADVNARSLSSGGTPLHGAADNGRLDITRILLKWGADVTATNFFMDTSCHLAAYRGDAGIVSLLLGAGTDCNAKNSRANTVQDEAQCGKYVLADGNHALVQYLINSHKSATSASHDSLRSDVDASLNAPLDRRRHAPRRDFTARNKTTHQH